MSWQTSDSVCKLHAGCFFLSALQILHKSLFCGSSSAETFKERRSGKYRSAKPNCHITKPTQLLILFLSPWILIFKSSISLVLIISYFGSNKNVCSNPISCSYIMLHVKIIFFFTLKLLPSRCSLIFTRERWLIQWLDRHEKKGNRGFHWLVGKVKKNVFFLEQRTNLNKKNMKR